MKVFILKEVVSPIIVVNVKLLPLIICSIRTTSYILVNFFKIQKILISNTCSSYHTCIT